MGVSMRCSEPGNRVQVAIVRSRGPGRWVVGPLHTSHHMKEPIEFTPREKILINYYRDRQLSGGSRALAYHISFIIGPLLCAGFFFWISDGAWILVGYALLLYRVSQSLWS